MKMKRTPIRNRVQSIILIVSLVVLVLTSLVSVISLVSIRRQSEHALTRQLEVNLLNTIADKAALADARFGKFQEYVNDFASLIHRMYQNPDGFSKKEILPPNAINKGHMTMQRYLRDEKVTLKDVQKEMELFGNLEYYWESAFSQNKDVITTIYLGTTSGLHVAYDPASDLGVEEGSAESHFDYTESDWYVRARNSASSGFTDIYEDSYGRGLMVSCYAPFYDEKAAFRGVVCMDMLIPDIYKEIVSLDLGEGSAVYLIDRSGNTVDSQDGALRTVSQHVSSEDVLNAIENKEEGFKLANDVYYAYSPVERTDWELCIGVPRDTILSDVDSMRHKALNAMIIFLIMLGALGFIVTLIAKKFAKSLTDPLIALGKDTQTISEGNLEYRANIERNDEIGDLAQRFNDMAVALKRYIADLTQVTAEKERIGAELNVATQIQADMLPRIFPPFPERKEFDIYATMTPAKEVGGDFYDFFLIDSDHIALVMADVSGKGVPAALFMVIAKTLIKTRTQMGGTPGEILADVNNQLCEGNEAGLFVTVWLGIIEISTGKGMSANAGHEHPAIRRANGAFELIKYKHSPVVAAMEGIPFKERDFELAPGDMLYVYTDGVPEATDANEELFGEERTLAALNQDLHAGPKAITENVKRAIDDFVGEAQQFDDITMLCMEYYGVKKDEEASEK